MGMKTTHSTVLYSSYVFLKAYSGWLGVHRRMLEGFRPKSRCFRKLKLEELTTLVDRLHARPALQLREGDSDIYENHGWLADS